MTPKILLLVLSLLAGFFLINTSQAEPIVQAQNSNQSVTLDMQNMTCAMCKIIIKKALQSVDGVQDVKVDPESKTSTVIFSPQKTTIEALIKATTNAGYPATIRQPK